MLSDIKKEMARSSTLKKITASQNHVARQDPVIEEDIEPHHRQLKEEWRIYSMALNACLGSWFQGYNLGVYNSAQRVIQKINGWDEDEFYMYTAIITASMPFGALIGALFSRQIIEYIKGIRKSMLIFDMVGIIGTIILILDTHVANLIIGRFVSGLYIGINTAIVPIYIKDFSPIEISGKSGAVNQIVLTFGLCCSYIISLVLPLPSETNEGYNDPGPWRIVLGLPMIAPALRFFILLYIFRLETPTVMMKEQRYSDAKQFFKQIYKCEKDVQDALHAYEDKAIDELAEGQKQNKKTNNHLQVEEVSNGGNKSTHRHELVSNQFKDDNPQKSEESIKNEQITKNEFNENLPTIIETQMNIPAVKPRFKTPLGFYNEKIYELSNKETYWRRFILGCLIQFCTQCSGINAILFYSNSIFQETAGGSGSAAELTARQATIGFGAAMVVFNLMSFYLLGKFGRRTLMVFGVGIVCITLFVFAGLQKVEKSDGINILCVSIIQLYNLGWQISLGAVTWVLTSEILDRYSISVSSFIRWVATMAVGLIFPYMRKDIELFGSFLVFGSFTVTIFIYIIFQLKETSEKDRYEILQSYCNEQKYKELEKIANEYSSKAFEEQQRNLVIY